jgi:hypothetical protein
VSQIVAADDLLSAPKLHYIVLNGYDKASGEFSYLDTDGQEKIISWTELATRLGWSVKIPEGLRDALQALMPLARMLGLGNVDHMFSAIGNTVIVGTRNS